MGLSRLCFTFANKLCLRNRLRTGTLPKRVHLQLVKHSPGLLTTHATTNHGVQIQVDDGDLTISKTTILIDGQHTTPVDFLATVMVSGASGTATLIDVHFRGLQSGTGAMLGACSGMFVCLFVCICECSSSFL